MYKNMELFFFFFFFFSSRRRHTRLTCDWSSDVCSSDVVDPQSTELRIIRSHVAALPPGVSRVGFVQIGWNQGITNWYSDEIGIPSSARPWTLEPAVLLILREEGRLNPVAPPAVDTYSWYTTTFPKGEPVIDLRQELQSLR